MKRNMTLPLRTRLSFHLVLLFVFVFISKLAGETSIPVIDDHLSQQNTFNQKTSAPLLQNEKLNLTDNSALKYQDINPQNSQDESFPDNWINDPQTISFFSRSDEEQIPPSDSMFWFYLLGTAVLVCGAGLFSGLTLGVLSLDHTTLLVLSNSGPEDQRRYAKEVLPIVKQHHHVLVTLLISNAAAAETMPIFLEQIVPASAAVAISVFLLLVFGEIIPQAICSRYGLAIGAKLSWFLKLLMFLTYPLSKPTAMFLDYLLGANHATFFRRAELSTLIGLHAEKEDTNAEPLSADEVAIIKGALEMTSKNIKQAMVPLKSVFMLSEDDVLDHSTLERIARKGHSRIPIYQDQRTNIVGVVLVKNLLQYNASDRVPLATIAGKELTRFPATTAMYDALNEFQTGRSHLGIVEEEGIPIGIITLEDLIEELLQEEIEDEKDRTKKMKVGLMQLLSRGSSMSLDSGRDSDAGAIPLRSLKSSTTSSSRDPENESQPLIPQ